MSTNPTYKPSESKREEFRKYLEKNGVMDALTKVLVNLYEEAQKPEDALEYIRDKLALLAGLETYKEMAKKLDDVEDRARQLEAQLQQGLRSGSQVSAPGVRASAMQEPTVAPSAAQMPPPASPRASASAQQQPVAEEEAPQAGEEPAPEASAEAPAEEPAADAEQPPPEESQ